jgi:LacI family transcriptional regulator
MADTIEDIAKEAGVSASTVSRVLNNAEIVHPETRARVRAVIAAHDYKPNIFARGLMRSRTDSVGVMVPNFTNPYFMAIVDAIENTLAQNDTHMYLCNPRMDPQAERDYVEELLRRNVDALILIEATPFSSADNHFLNLKADCPVILVNEHHSQETPHHIVRCDQAPGIREALRYFVSRDMRPLALVNGSDSYSFTLKENIFHEIREEYNLSKEDAPVYNLPGSPDQEGIVVPAAALCVKLAKSPGRPRAVFAANELIAAGLLQGALSAGLRVPEDLAIIAVDNTFLSRIGLSQLSTVDLRPEDVGRLTAELYLRVRNDRTSAEGPVRETISSRLILRSTT